MEIADRLDRVLHEQLGPGFEWNNATSLTGKPGLELDSLDLVELIMRCEEEFGIEIPDDALWGLFGPQFERVGDLADYIAGQLGERPALFAA